MKFTVEFMLSLLLVALFFTSCEKDKELGSPIDEFASEQNDLFPESRRSCGLEEKMTSLMQDPDFAKSHQEKFIKINKELEKLAGRSSCASPVIVPIAVHFQGVNNPDAACLIALAQSQIAVINKDITGTNTDISKWTNQASSNFPGVSNGEACVEFCIATKNHPDGYGLTDGSPAITINKTTGDSDNKWSGYINIFVQPNTGLLGYSPLGGSGNGDGVVIDAGAFGVGGGCGAVSPNAPFNLGRTLTHELGHYLLLDHIWGNGCNVDDDVADTPDQNSEYYDCPASNASSCGSTDMHMSYMDYVNDACMYMFSQGQTNRMEAYIAASLSNVTNNADNVCGGGTGGAGGGTGGGTTATCAKPGPASVANIMTTSAKVEWASEPQAIKYKIRYRATGTSTWASQNVTQATITLDNLTASTSYQYQVRTQCPAGWTGFNSLATFTTENVVSTCAKPNNSAVQNLSPVQVKVTWDAASQAVKYRLRYRKTGTSTWSAMNTTVASKTLSNLTANTTYQYQLRTQCPTGWTVWTTVQNFTTDSSGGGSNSNMITINLTLDDYGSETSWELLDEFGDVVATHGPFSDGTAGTIKTKTVVIEEGCYTLFLDDDYGDGICCAYGDGSLDVILDGQVITGSDGQFGYFDQMDFCIDIDGFQKGDQRKDQNTKLNDNKVAAKF